MSPFRQSSVAEEEMLMSLILAAQEDPRFKSQILSYLRQGDAERKALLSQWIKSSQAQGAPEAFCRTLALLMDDKIARRVIEALADGC